MPRRLLVVATVLAGQAVPPVLAAQEPRQQDKPPVTVPAYTDQQRWNRARFHIVSFIVAGIAHAKARGESAEQYGRFLGDLFGPGWGPINTGYPIRVARATLFNFAAMPGSEAHIAEASDTSATVQYRRTHVQQFGAERQISGVTLDEYDRALRATHERIAGHLGLRYDERVDGDWNVATVRGRGSAAVTNFPRGTYVVTLAPADTGRAELAGSWDVTYAPDGRYTVRRNGETVVQGAYDLRLDELTTRDETGPRACAGPGTYRWAVNARGELVVGRLSDACEGRTRFLTGRPLVMK